MSSVYDWKQLEYEIGSVLESNKDYRGIIEGVRPLLQKLLAYEELIPTAYQEPLPNKYAQYLLYKPDNEAFSVIAFIWGRVRRLRFMTIWSGVW